ncbi:MAG: ABC transporter substrate-binding protein [Candidatus Dormibacteraceae bacterium]
MSRLTISLLLILILGCTSAPALRPPDQVLRLAMADELDTLDPALLEPSQTNGPAVLGNVFGGLYRFDPALHQLPDAAAAAPEVSADGRTFRIRLRHGVRFSNGDPVRAADVLYSWNRAARKQGPSAGEAFGDVAGYREVATGAVAAMAGLTAPDPSTVVVTLARPRVDWASRLQLPATWLVDSRVVTAKGEDAWWTIPEGAVGTGPFRIESRQPGALKLAPVPGWWGGSTGSLRAVTIAVEPIEAQVSGYLSGHYDALGYAEAIRQPPDIRALLGALPAARAGEVHEQEWARTTLLGFDLRSGPLAGLEEGRDGRLALAHAIDQGQLARTVCPAHQCAPAGAGLLPSGLRGSGATVQPFDPARAQAEYRRWDPRGDRLRGLKLATWAPFRALAEQLRAQWKANLGLDIGLDVADPDTFVHNLHSGRYRAFLVGWIQDVDSPAAWFEAMLASSGSDNYAGYSRPEVDTALRRAAGERAPESDTDYRAAGELAGSDGAYVALQYAQRFILVRPGVTGVGAGTLYETPWRAVRILG